MKLNKQTLANVKTVNGKKNKGLPILSKVDIYSGILRTTDLKVSYTEKGFFPELSGIYEIVGDNLVKTDLDRENFPDKVKTVVIGNVDTKPFIELFEKAASVSSMDSVRVVINSVLIRSEEDSKIELVGTDGRQIFTESFINNFTPFPGDYVVSNPKRVLKILKSMQTQEILISKDEDGKFIEFTGGEKSLIAGICEGTYPKYRQVLMDIDVTYQINPKCAICAVKELMPYLKRMNQQPVHIIFKDEILTFKLPDGEFNDISFKVPAIKKEVNFKMEKGFFIMPMREGKLGEKKDQVAINADYLLSALKQLSNETVIFGLKKEATEDAHRGVYIDRL